MKPLLFPFRSLVFGGFTTVPSGFGRLNGYCKKNIARPWFFYTKLLQVMKKSSKSPLTIPSFLISSHHFQTTHHLTDFEPDLRVPSMPITCLGGISNQVLKKESSERRCKIQQAIFQFHRSIQRQERVPTKAGPAMGSKTGNREIFWETGIFEALQCFVVDGESFFCE